jgi:membrane protease YdiL (CAAX protease family)
MTSLSASMPDQTATALRFVLVGLWFIVLPLVERRRVLRLRAHSDSAGRIAWYRDGAAVSWLVALACLACAGSHDAFAPGYGAASLGAWLARPAVAAALLGGLLALFALQFAIAARCAFDARRRARLAPRLAALRCVLPVARSERRWWLFVSLTAGITEEIVTRGLLLPDLWRLLGGTPGWPLATALVGSSLLFAVAHLYQGPSGVVRSGAGGLFMGLLAVVSGGILVPIVVHMLADAQMLFLYDPVRDDPETAQRLVDGCPAPL